MSAIAKLKEKLERQIGIVESRDLINSKDLAKAIIELSAKLDKLAGKRCCKHKK